MADSSWDTYTADPPRRRIGGTVWAGLGLVAVLLALFLAAMAGFARRARGSAWTLVQHTAARLRTDDRARELYRANPGLADAYPTEEVFLEQLRPLRDGFKVPLQAPPEGRDYRVSSSPFDLQVRVKGEGGTWLSLALDLGGPLSGPPEGEGIRRLVLAPEYRELRRLEQKQRQQRGGRSWLRLVELARALAAEDGLRKLRGEHPGLRLAPADPVAFEALLRQRAAALRALPRDREGAKGVAIRITGTPFRRTEEVSATLPDGGSLRAVWVSRDLAAVELQ